MNTQLSRIRARASKDVDRVAVGHTVMHKNRLVTTAPQRQLWAAAPILIVQRSPSQLFLSIRLGRATALTETNLRRTVMIASNCAWRVVVCMRSSKESSRFFSVEAVALQNLPQTFRGRERSKRGYASPLLPYSAFGGAKVSPGICSSPKSSVHASVGSYSCS